MFQFYSVLRTTAKHGGVGAPVGLTVFKTAGGSLGAVPGGFDSHTPLPFTIPCFCVPSGITLEKPKNSALILEKVLNAFLQCPLLTLE